MTRYGDSMEESIQLSGSSVQDVLANGEQRRKLAILGLPWETSEATLRLYFGQYGTLESAEIMKDRYTGKSRGFGFVTFVDPTSAERALLTEHSIDGRRCEAKIALPKGEPAPTRTTRIFVARIPPSVAEAQFRSYFEKFGKLQDAYMPKDHTKQGYRGIGFVTFASPDSVEKVMAMKHWLNGHEVAIDRANPKEDGSTLRQMFARLPAVGPGPQRRSFDTGAGLGLVHGPLGNLVNLGSSLGSLSAEGLGSEGSYGSSIRALSEEREQAAAANNSRRSLDHMIDLHGALGPRTTQALALQSLGLVGSQAAAHQGMDAAAAAAAASQAAIQLANARTALQNAANMGVGMAGLSSLAGSLGMSSPPELSAANIMNSAGAHYLRDMVSMPGSNGNNVSLPMVAPSAAGKRVDPALLKRVENPAIASVRAGPRLFIGKLTKDTSEADVKEYFQKFGYVMDVYLPKSKDNKAEHRGFGFVTFETEAAIQRVVAHGPHRLKGSTIAIDIAMPKVEDGEMGMDNMEQAAAAAMVQKDSSNAHNMPLDQLASWGLWPCMPQNSIVGWS